MDNPEYFQVYSNAEKEKQNTRGYQLGISCSATVGPSGHPWLSYAVPVLLHK